LFALGLRRDAFARRQQVDRAVSPRVQAVEALVRFEIVCQLVSRPPSQRWSMLGHAGVGRGLLDGVARLLLGPTNSTPPPRPRGRHEVLGLLELTVRLLEVDDVDAARSTEDVAAHLGFQRRV